MQPVPAPLTLSIDGSFDPTRSLLGRAITARVADSRQAASVFLVTAVTLTIAVTVAFYGLWAWLQDSITVEPFGPVALTVWTIQVGTLVVFIVTTLIGFSAPTEIVLGSEMRIRRGDQEFVARIGDLSVTEIGRDLYYNHYRRYAETLSFVRHLSEGTLLLIQIGSGRPIVLELDRHDREAFIDAHAARMRAMAFRRSIIVPLHVEAELVSA